MLRFVPSLGAAKGKGHGETKRLMQIALHAAILTAFSLGDTSLLAVSHSCETAALV